MMRRYPKRWIGLAMKETTDTLTRPNQDTHEDAVVVPVLAAAALDDAAEEAAEEAALEDADAAAPDEVELLLAETELRSSTAFLILGHPDQHHARPTKLRGCLIQWW